MTEDLADRFLHVGLPRADVHVLLGRPERTTNWEDLYHVGDDDSTGSTIRREFVVRYDESGTVVGWRMPAGRG